MSAVVERRPSSHPGLDDRSVRLLADGLNIQTEQYVAHCRVADDDDLVDVAAVEIERARHVAYLEVDGGEHDLSEFTVVLAAVVGDPVHDVAAAETLRILERRGVQNLSGFQIN